MEPLLILFSHRKTLTPFLESCPGRMTGRLKRRTSRSFPDSLSHFPMNRVSILRSSENDRARLSQARMKRRMGYLDA